MLRVLYHVRALVLSSVVLCFVGSFAFLAAEDECYEESTVYWRHSLGEAVIEARDRNALILVIFSQDGDNIAPGALFEDEKLAQFVEKYFVVLSAHPRAEKGKRHKPHIKVNPKTKKKYPFCPYLRMDCRIHEKVATEVSEFLKPSRTPCDYIITWRKEIVHDGEKNPVDPNRFSPEAYRKAYIDAQRKFGRRPVRAQDFRQLIAAETALKDKAYAEGLDLLLPLTKKLGRYPKPMREHIKELKVEYETTAESLFEAAKKLVATSRETARSQMVELAKQFKRLDIGHKIRRVIAELPKDDD